MVVRCSHGITAYLTDCSAARLSVSSRPAEDAFRAAETRCSPPHQAAADCRSSINGMNNLRCAQRTTDSASQNSDLQPPPPSAADVGIGERQRDQIIDVVGRPAKRHVGPEDIDEP